MLIQHNWVVLAYNLNVVILVLITGESSICAIYAYHFITILSLLLPCIIILFLHLLSTNIKCIQPCYFPLLYKPDAQKLKKIWSTLICCSRRAITPGRLPVELWCLSAAMLLRVFDLVFCKDIIQ
jgi:hypothetical protein